VRIIWLSHGEDANTWRLQLDAGEGAYPDGKMIDLRDFSGDLRDPGERGRINGIIESWGFQEHPSQAWADELGGWVVGVFELPR
jgi:hypothetical protein